MIARAVAAAVVAASAAASAAPLKLPGFPLKVAGAVQQAPAFADVNADGSLELVVVHGASVSVYGADAKVLPGWPVDAGALAEHADARVVGPPAVGDLDGDGKAEIALALSFGEASDGAIVVLKQDGLPALGGPVALARGPGAGPTIADVNGDGRGDLVFGSREGQLLAVDGRGAPLPGFPVKLSGAVTSPIAFGSLVRGGKPAIVVGTSDGRLHAILPGGQSASGFPIQTKFAITGAPALGDIDNDGEHEVVVASQDFNVYAVNADGSAVGGFPLRANYRFYGGPALADLDRDGALDIVVGSGDGKIHAWTSRGRLLPGFPVSAGLRFQGHVVVADGDRDGREEIFAAGTDGNVYAYTSAGKPIDGFPLRVGGDLSAAPLLGDYVKDPSVELVVGTPGGDVQGWRLQRRGEVPMSALAWPAQGHDAARQGHFGPNAARYRELVLSPSAPRAGDVLKLSYDFYDLDGDAEPATLVRWTVDDVPVPELDGKKEVPAARLRRGQRWKAAVQAPEDFALFKDGPGATIAVSPVVKVADTAPSAPKVAIEPSPARATDALSVRIVENAADVDGDAISYRYRWFRDGDPQGDRPALTAGQAKKGERWRVQVVPNDGELDGPPAEAEIVVQNSVPSAPEIALEPATPTAETELRVRLVKPATDADGDEVSYRYLFTLNGERRAQAADSPVFPKLVARRGDVVAVEAWANDRDGDSPPVRAEVRLANAPPIAPKVTISPSSPRTGDALTAGVAAGAADPDADALSYRVRWLRDGAPVALADPTTVPASATEKGQRWRAEIVAFDGEVEGPAAGAEVVIGNSAPGAARIAVSSGAPAIDEAVQVTIAEPAGDPDRDAVRYEYAWTVDGKPASFAKDKSALAPGEFRKGQRWVVEVTPVDADGARGEPTTLEVRPRNTPPTAPALAVEPKDPTTATGLRAVVSAPASDRDGDPVSYRYRWLRNGLHVAEAGDKPELKPALVRRGDEWRVVAIATDGEAEGPAAEARASIGNLPPTAPKIELRPAKPQVASGLACEVVQVAKDPDGDALTLEYRWSLDGQRFPLPADAAKIPAGVLRAGQVWRCEVVARDAGASGPEATAQATVVNTPPTAPSVAVEPKKPLAGDLLTCGLSGEATDVDGDRVRYEFRWTPPAGVKLPALEDPARVPGSFVRKGQRWACAATAKDASAGTPGAAAEATVGNTPPRPPRVRIAPPDAPAGEELRCELAEPAHDPDGDRLSYAFTWFRNGERQPFAETSAAVPGRLVKKRDRWRCAAAASDGEQQGPAGRSPELTVGEPSAPKPAAGR